MFQIFLDHFFVISPKAIRQHPRDQQYLTQKRLFKARNPPNR